jgi:aminotransferase
MAHVSIASFPDIRDRVIVVNSFSKTYAMTGWRIGYAAGSSQVIKQITKLQEHIAACVCSVSQKAALEDLEGSQESLEYMLARYRSRGDTLVEGLTSFKGISCIKPKGTFYVFANVKELCSSSEKFAMDLLKKTGVCLIPGTAFGEGGEGYVRISYATSEDKIEEGLVRLKKYVANL